VPEPAPTAVIFDLDGTLVQTRLASWEVFRGVSESHGLGIREPDEFFALFDGNLYASLRRVCRDEEHAIEVKQALLDALGSSYRPWPVPGIAGVVRRLASESTLAVMSSNSTDIIRRILSEHGLALCFSHVFGGDVTESKQLAIGQFLDDATFGPGRRCEGSYDETETPLAHDPSRTVLVTDTAGDVREARAAGIRAVGVAWGMHSPQDLLAAGAEFVALWPQEILSHLLGTGASRPPEGACALPSRPALGVASPPTEILTAVREGQPAGGSVPCRCGGHWARRCSGDCVGRCGESGGCGGCPSRAETSSVASSAASAVSTAPDGSAGGSAQVRSQRRQARGRDASSGEPHRGRQAQATSSGAGAEPSHQAKGRRTARELRAALALICD
jgi:phosphoglycolate phosphatase